MNGDSNLVPIGVYVYFYFQCKTTMK